ncbi:MAG: hypothetical protein K8I60_04080 [Anaerolineae bacterium]|nr:hypothetical protein [Anaerolineae bacterium]
MLFRSLVIVILGIILSTGLTAAQEAESCPATVETALQSLDQLCQATERNQACYGHQMLVAEAQPDSVGFKFDTPGDLTLVNGIRSLHLQPFDEADAIWGVALMKLQANLPDTLPGQNVTVLLFGDVALQASQVSGYNPMQAFYLQAGSGDAFCQEMPNSGILIQTPEGAMEIEFLINAVTITLGSTVYIHHDAGNDMVVAVVDGQAQVAAFAVTRNIPAGGQVTIPLGADGTASGAPGAVTPYTLDDVQALPVSVLPDDITVAPPLDIASVCSIRAPNTVNLRQGPGKNYPTADTLAAGDTIEPVEQARGLDGFTWWHTPCGLWVRSDVVQETGDCDNLPRAADLPPTPTPMPSSNAGTTSSSAQSGAIDNRYVIQMCAVQDPADGPLLAGQRIHFSIGAGGWPSEEAARAALAGKYAIITVDGVELPNFINPIHTWPANDESQRYVTSAVATWIVTPGTHTVHGEWPGVDAATREGTCVIVIP